MTDKDILDIFYTEAGKPIHKTRKLTNDEILYIETRHSDCHDIKESVFRMKNHLDVCPKCPVCGKPLAYKGGLKGYAETCGSKDCRYKKTQSTLQKEHQSIIEAKMLTAPKCPICGKPRQLRSKNVFAPTCGDENCWKQNAKDSLRQTMLDRYGVDNPAKLESVQEKIKATSLEKYGVDNPAKADSIKEKTKLTSLRKYGKTTPLLNDSIKEQTFTTMTSKYGVRYALQNEDSVCRLRNTSYDKFGADNFCRSAYYYEMLDSIIEKRNVTCTYLYGATNYTLSDEFKSRIPEINAKRYNTHKKNNSFNTSSIEQQLVTFFKENNIDFKYQYKSDNYPFACDFYFPQADLYVEIQGHWTHGKHPYDSTSKEDQEQLAIWESKSQDNFYRNAIKCWTVSDVNKRNLAKERGLNYLEVFSCSLSVCTEAILSRIAETQTSKS
jgi:hypothetical protein